MFTLAAVPPELQRSPRKKAQNKRLDARVKAEDLKQWLTVNWKRSLLWSRIGTKDVEPIAELEMHVGDP